MPLITLSGMQKDGKAVSVVSEGNEQLSSCYVMGVQRSIFLAPLGDDKTEAEQSTYTYGNCNNPYVVQTSGTDNACTNTIKNLGAIASPDAPEVSIVNASWLRQPFRVH
ncbi:hypothetical protein JFY74_07745 [Pectobacterium carotovorum]|nr:hypothetical protein JFY74_07745 [Pectobacterium carotovorum]